MSTASIFVLTLALLAVLQFALMCGIPAGRFAWGGKHRVLPTRQRIGSAVSLMVYAVFALVVLDRGGRVEVLPHTVAVVGTWIVFGLLVLSAAANALSASKSERFTMTPVALLLSVTSLLAAIG